MKKYIPSLLIHKSTYTPDVSELVLAGVELILFIAAGMVLGFGFVTKPALTTQGSFSNC